MKKLIPILIFLFTIVNSNAQKELINSEDPKDLIGIQTKKDFEGQHYPWFHDNYIDYALDQDIAKNIKKHSKGIHIKAFMGTWCGDSQELVPVFYKLLDEINFDQNNLSMIAVNREKKTPDNLQEGLNITNVPTFIFYKNDKEIGRFVEFPRESLEKDMLKIVSGKSYKHSYEE